MTICIAAIGKDDNGTDECIVFATDHMVTYRIWKFEHVFIKYKRITKDTIAMLSGEALLFDNLIKNTFEEKTYDEIRSKIQANFDEIKQKRRTTILKKYHAEEDDLKNYVKSGAQNDLLAEIYKAVTDYEIKTSILLIGFNDEGKAMMCSISEYDAIEYRDMNFNAIGSGEIQAINTLMFQKHDKNDSLVTTIYDVFKAKKNAEVHEGVGKNTDIVILRRGAGCKKLGNDDIKILERIYEQELTKGRKHGDLKKLKVR